MRAIGTILFVLLVVPAIASAGVVRMVQPPAWVVRGETQIPITSGTRVQSNDIIRTGARARVRIGLREGSDIRVGPLARVELPRLDAPESDDSGVFQGIIDVLQGAFRFTTGQVGAERERDITVNIGAVNIGVRGTDLWGKSTPDRDFVVLLEGVIDAASDRGSTRLDQPGTAYIQPRDGAPQAGVRIPGETIARYAKETARIDARAALTADGRWQTLLDSLRDAGRAEAARTRYREAGYPVEIEQVRIDGARWHRLFIDGSDTRAGAAALGEEFEQRFNVRDAWVRRVD